MERNTGSFEASRTATALVKKTCHNVTPPDPQEELRRFREQRLRTGSGRSADTPGAGASYRQLFVDHGFPSA